MLEIIFLFTDLLKFIILHSTCDVNCIHLFEFQISESIQELSSILFNHVIDIFLSSKISDEDILVVSHLEFIVEIVKFHVLSIKVISHVNSDSITNVNSFDKGQK